MCFLEDAKPLQNINAKEGAHGDVTPKAKLPGKETAALLFASRQTKVIPPKWKRYETDHKPDGGSSFLDNHRQTQKAENCDYTQAQKEQEGKQIAGYIARM
jgi:hypothetical protein